MNEIVLMGRLTRDPELRKTPSGVSVTAFTLAVDDNELKEKKSYYIPCILFGKRAEAFAKNVQKGDRALVSGKLTQRSYEYNNQRRVAFEVVCENFEFIEPKRQHEERAPEDIPETPTYGNYVEDDLGE